MFSESVLSVWMKAETRHTKLTWECSWECVIEKWLCHKSFICYYRTLERLSCRFINAMQASAVLLVWLLFFVLIDTKLCIDFLCLCLSLIFRIYLIVVEFGIWGIWTESRNFPLSNGTVKPVLMDFVWSRELWDGCFEVSNVWPRPRIHA